MDDVWFGSNLTHRDMATLFQSLSLKGSRFPPLLAIADRGDHVVVASRALLRFFGVTDGEALRDRLIAGRDPGARRLSILCQNLTINGAPRLERLRFFVSPASEVVTFLCRRILFRDDRPIFVAAALGLPVDEASVAQIGSADPLSEVDPDAMRVGERIGIASPGRPLSMAPDQPDPTAPPTSDGVDAALTGDRATVSPAVALGTEPQFAPAVQANSRAPARRIMRFLWRADANLVCTELSPQLAEVVGASSADMIGRSLVEEASRLDPSGALGRALASRTTWAGLKVAWPMAGGGTEVSLGAVPALTRDHAFDGYRGYGVVRLDGIAPPQAGPIERSPPEIAVSDTVVPFPGPKPLSPEDQRIFRALAVELRDQVGPAAAPAEEPQQPAREPAQAPDNEPLHVASAPRPGEPPPDAEPTAPAHDRAADVARNGLAILDRLAVALLVSRNDVPIFANRHMLDLTGFTDEDALHAAGGMSYLFGDVSGNASGAERIGVRTRDGEILPVTARMQRVDWDGLPATLLTLQATESSLRSPAPHEPVPEVLDKPAQQEGGSASHRDGDELRDLRAILETATDGVAIIDAQGNVLSLNRSGEALFGCDRSVVIGKPFLDLFAVPNQGLAADYLDGLMSSATKSLLNDGREMLVQAHENGTIPVFMTLGRLGSADGETSAPRLCALFRDLTPWKRVEQDLQSARQGAERASALKSDVLAKVSHEIRTPLNAIIGFAEAMSEERFGPLGSARYKDDLRAIHASGLHVMSLVDDLLDLSKIEAGKMELALNPVDANRIVGESVALMQPQASRERVIMRLSLAPNLPHIRVDERSLRQILLNVLSNAVKFNEPGGQVIVATTRREDGVVVVRVRDTGPGMSESDLAAAMEPFRQLAKGRSADGGTGLGLPLTKALVEANEATFSIRSNVGQGTMIEVCFPPAPAFAGKGNT